MKSLGSFLLRRFVVLVLVVASCSTTPEPEIAPPKIEYGPEISVWKSSPDRALAFSTTAPIKFIRSTTTEPVVSVDTAVHYQAMDGFGYTLTGGSVMLMSEKLIPSARAGLLKELFLTEGTGIGISYLRISIGASDLDDHVFSYDDMPVGETDVNLDNFSIEPDKEYLIPVLKEILALNPGLKILGSPWSAPTWMKTNGEAKGGSLKEEFYGVYAQYFVKYVQAMQGEGIKIDAITVQNEPENPHNTPSMTMTAEEQNLFIKNYLGPAFQAAGIDTKIILFDHNCDHPNYPISILNDPVTREFVDGSAFHLYGGSISALTTVHDTHPDKNVYFTEQWTSGNGNYGGDLRWHMKNVLIGATRNWSKNVLEWNLASDENFDPHTEGGCTECQGAITINSITGGVKKNVSYYVIAHASRLVRPGSVRVYSTNLDDLYTVAFLTPEGKKVLIALNDSDQKKVFMISFNNMTAVATLEAGYTATYYW